MRISFWQQFSSNNSSYFTVIGQFADAEQALAAAAEISQLLREVGRWYEQPENRAARSAISPPRHGTDQPLTPIEKEFSEKYKIDWGPAIDWMRQAAWEGEAVDIMDRFILITNLPFAYSWMDCHPIDDLIEHLGGKAICESDRVGGYSVAIITATAPDSGTATRLYETISAYLSIDPALPGEGLPIPWLNYWKAEMATPDVVPDNLTTLEAAYLARERQTDEFNQSSQDIHEQLFSQADEADKAGEHVRAAELRQQWADIEANTLKTLPQLPPDDEDTLRNARNHARGEGEIQREKEHLRLSLTADPASHNLFAAMQYLRLNGCSVIQFTFEQRFRGGH